MMMSRFDRLEDLLEKLTEQKEKDNVKRYSKLLREVNEELAKSYEKYEKGGKLTYTEMAKHNRLEKLIKEISSLVEEKDKELKEDIQQHLKEQYEESYYQTAYIVETSSETRLAYTTLKDEVIDAAINNRFSGLTLNERLERRRVELIYKMQETITRGLVDGDTYRTIAEKVKKDLEGDLSKANRIVRTESRRIREEGGFNSALHAKSKGIVMKKTWRCMSDERSRKDHINMDGKTVDIDEYFTLNRRKGMHPLDRNFLAKDVINCRCYLSKKIDRIERPQHEGLADLTYVEWQKERLK